MARRCGTILLALFLAVFAVSVPDAEAWSEPVETKQWSEPEYTEPWSEPVYVQPWTEAEYVDPWAEVTETELYEPDLSGESGGEIDPFLLDWENLLGSWKIWRRSMPLGQGQVVEGADQGLVIINEDGTYILAHIAWSREPVIGTWRLSYPREINGEVVQAIILEDGPGGSPWAVAPDVGGEIRLLFALELGADSALWIFDAELYR